MRPTPVEIMRGIQGSIVGHIIPEMASSYAQAQAMYSIMLMEVVVTNLDRAASDLCESNRQFAALLRETKAALEHADTPEAKEARATLAAADLEPNESSILLTDLRAEWARLAGLVAAVVPLVERSPSEPALLALRPLRQRYIAALRDDTQRRMVPVLGSG